MKLSVYGQWYRHSTDLASTIPYHEQYFSYCLWLYCYGCIHNSMVHIPIHSRSRDVHHIHTMVDIYGEYEYGSIPWAPSMTQNMAISIQLEYGHGGSGQGQCNVIEVNIYDLNEVNTIHILTTDLHHHHQTVHIQTMVQIQYRLDLNHTVPWVRFFIQLYL